jgi:hypothetical protein
LYHQHAFFNSLFLLQINMHPRVVLAHVGRRAFNSTSYAATEGSTSIDTLLAAYRSKNKTTVNEPEPEPFTLESLQPASTETAPSEPEKTSEEAPPKAESSGSSAVSMLLASLRARKPSSEASKTAAPKVETTTASKPAATTKTAAAAKDTPKPKKESASKPATETKETQPASPSEAVPLDDVAVLESVTEQVVIPQESTTVKEEKVELMRSTTSQERRVPNLLGGGHASLEALEARSRQMSVRELLLRARLNKSDETSTEENIKKAHQRAREIHAGDYSRYLPNNTPNLPTGAAFTLFNNPSYSPEQRKALAEIISRYVQ